LDAYLVDQDLAYALRRNCFIGFRLTYIKEQANQAITKVLFITPVTSAPGVSIPAKRTINFQRTSGTPDSASGTQRTNARRLWSAMSEERKLTIIFTADEGITNITDVLINGEQARGAGQ